jgi:hypothetical protein
MNHYTQFAVLVAKHLTAEEREWIRRQEAERELFWETGLDEDPELREFWADLEGVAFEATECDELVVTSEGEGNPDAAAALITRFLADNRPREIVVFEWANTATKLLPGAHSGGLAVISAQETVWFASAQWAEETAAHLRTTLQHTGANT